MRGKQSIYIAEVMTSTKLCAVYGVLHHKQAFHVAVFDAEPVQCEFTAQVLHRGGGPFAVSSLWDTPIFYNALSTLSISLKWNW